MQNLGRVIAGAVDQFFNRVKIKSPQYVSLNCLGQNFTRNRCYDLLRTNDTTEFLAYFPEVEEEYNMVRDAINSFIIEATQFYFSIDKIESQKDFAEKALTKLYSGFLFEMRKKKCESAKEWVFRQNNDKLDQIVASFSSQ